MSTRWLLSTIGVWVAVSIVLQAGNADPDILVIGSILGLGSATLSTILTLLRSAQSMKWPRKQPELNLQMDANERAERMRSQAYATTTLGSAREPEQDSIRATLVRLTDQRLFDHHQIERATQSEAAAGVLTTNLRSLVGGEPMQFSGPADLRNILTEIEEL